ncbi:protein kinase domain-containing protein [Enterococcus sp. AZ192]|uniref:protein kinase domain-containing protein n=1 Tax=unclassified Enterococcus TaxID=2608891 RepID=UPI003D295D36
MEVRLINGTDLEWILNTHGINYMEIKKFPKSGQKAVFGIVCESETMILKIYNVTPYETINQIEYSSVADMEELMLQKNEEIRFLNTYIFREVSAAKKCPIFPKLIICDEIQEYKVGKHIYKYYFEEAVKGVPMNDSRYYSTTNSLSEIAFFLKESLELVKLMWNTTYVHRDIKPNNIIIEGNKVNFIDPGLAKSAEDETLTRTGMAMGTPRYWAPEQKEIQSNYTWTFKFESMDRYVKLIDMLPDVSEKIEMILELLETAKKNVTEFNNLPNNTFNINSDHIAQYKEAINSVKKNNFL